ncbi:MAG: hypothetical protein QNI97_18030 [Desulfobacterales bacterium]|nr:hypothetical protein [Desulfobacterales bacterium]MDJ0855180.1 hypothetical protein [Desulfobacterales bacterium]
MDLHKRAALIEKIKSIALPETTDKTPVVTLEDFFEGNDDTGSISAFFIVFVWSAISKTLPPFM